MTGDPLVSRVKYELSILESAQVTGITRDHWLKLFARCFKTSLHCAQMVFEKYCLNEARFCFMYVDKKLVASYSGLVLDLDGRKIFLSTDTMSDGTYGGASVVCGRHLYEHLKKLSIKIVIINFNSKL